MTKFQMVKYHKRKYPDIIPLNFEEITCDLDKEVLKGDESLIWSLHTEFSYGKRKLNSKLIAKYNTLVESNKSGVPQLWKNKKWVKEFAHFIIDLSGKRKNIGVIEIHPPFNDYSDIDTFLDNYKYFNEIIRKVYPKVQIVIENRNGNRYKGGEFIVKKTEDIFQLVKKIDKTKSKLKLAYDVMQIYSAQGINTKEGYIKSLKKIKEIKSHIYSVHLWGTKLSSKGRRCAHAGDLNSYFNNKNTKLEFLKAFKNTFNDNIARKLVLEINSNNDDTQSICKDLLDVGIKFV